MTAVHRRESGMTLIEVLIAVTLLAMLATMIASGTRLTARAWNTAEIRTGDADDLDAIQGFLRRTITAARPSFASADPSDGTIVFAGASDRLTVVAPRPGLVDGDGAWMRMTFFVAPAARSRALLLSWQEDAPPAAGQASPPMVLLDHVAAVRFRYFGRPTADTPAAWFDSWNGGTSLPELISIDIQRDNAARPAWPVQIVETRATTNSGCIYAPRRADCQRARR